jgi:predicted ArsR family transcriptional regulator
VTVEARSSLSPTEFASAVTAITSAFGDPTRREIYLFAHGAAEGVTASEVAERFDLHPNVARHHLDKLAAGGYVDIATARSAGGAGRPSKRYRVVEGDMGVEIPVRNEEVILRLLGRALAELGRERAEELAEEVGTAYGVEMADAMGSTGVTPRSVRTALHSIADALSAHGFAAHAEREGDTLRLVAEHCPFGETAVQHPVLCALDRGMVSGMLTSLYRGETSVDLQSSRSMGDAVCVTSVDS